MGCIISCCDPNEQVSITCRRPRVPPAYVVQEPGLLARLGKKLRQLWQGDNGQCDIEGCDNGQCDIEQGDGDHIYERKLAHTLMSCPLPHLPVHVSYVLTSRQSAPPSNI
nr:hypothetical protein CFP56_49165 [Quercus suber]